MYSTERLIRAQLYPRYPFLPSIGFSLLYITAALLVCTVSVPSVYAGKPGSNRPKVGLVLGGGGAKGFAHIGVLRWLEENRIPVDYVAGTSMGGLVGAFYAMGWSVPEIEKTIEQLNWDHLFESSPPYRVLHFRRKRDSRLYPSKLEMGIKNGLALPGGLIAGHFIGLLFDRLTLAYGDMDSFDELPIPFRCVATNLENADAVVLENGSLSLSLRATMAIPGAFIPIRYQGKLLADGGLLDNLPTKVAKDMGADIIIAVNVGSPLKKGSDLESILGIVDQTINVLILANVRRSLQHADIILQPDLEGYETMDFLHAEEIVETGYRIAQEKGPLLQGLSLSQNAWDSHLNERRIRKIEILPVPDEIIVTGVDDALRESIEKDLKHHKKKQIDSDQLDKDLTAIYGVGRYYSLGYGLQSENSSTSLLFRATEKSYGPPFMRFGFSIDGSELNRIRLGLNGRMTFLDAGTPGAEVRLDLGIGSRTVATGEYYVPLFGGLFVAPRGFYTYSSQNLFEEQERIAEFRTIYRGGALDLGYGFGSQIHELRFGYQLNNVDSAIRIGSPIDEPVKGNQGSLNLRWILDTLNHPTIPSKGVILSVTGKHFFHSPGIEHSFDQFSTRLSSAFEVGSKGILFFRGMAGTSFNELSPRSETFSLGGIFRIGALHPGELRGSSVLFGSTGYLYQVAEPSLMFGDRIFVGGWYETGTAWNPNQTKDFVHSLSGGVVVDTLFGPIYFGAGVGTGKRFLISFRLGSVF